MTNGNAQGEHPTESSKPHDPAEKSAEQGEHSKDAIDQAAFDDAKKLHGEKPLGAQ